MKPIKIKVWTNLLTFILALLLLGGSAQTAQAATKYVKAGGAGSQDGTSWTNAYPDIQAAINAAADGDQIWVAAGYYYGRITLKNGVALYGGFAGNETALNQRNWRINVTTIDGNHSGMAVTVVTVPHSVSARIDGFTITNGGGNDYGGGIYCGTDSQPVISNNLILWNSARQRGGGIYCDVDSIPVITGNEITMNGVSYYTVDDGGGIYLNASNGFVISNNLIRGSYPNAVFCKGAGTINNNTIVLDDIDQSSGTYGIAYIVDSNFSTAHIISNNIIKGFASTVYGAGYGLNVLNSGGATLTIANNCLYGNTTPANVTLPAGNITSDPKFVNDYDFHLQSASPCINAGTTANGEGATVALDLDGNNRQNGTIDIGAYEWYLTATISGPAMNFTNQNPFTVNITFNTSVTDFTAGDLTVAATSGTSTVSYLTGSADQYTATINNQSSAKVTISLTKGTVHANGSANLAASLDVIYDRYEPNIVWFTINGGNPTNNTVVNWQIAVQDLPANYYSGAYQMRLSNDGVTWSDWMPFDSKIANYEGWTLATPYADNTVYAQAMDRAGNISATKSASVAWAKAAAPTFSTAAGSYNTPVSLTLATTDGSPIRYTTNGSEVDESSTLYTGPILIDATTTVRAKAFHADNWLPSDEVSATYTINSTVTSYQPVNDDPPTSANILRTVQNIEGDLSVQYNSATLRLGKGRTGKLSNLWLYYPNLIGSGSGQIPTDAKIVSAQIVLTVKGFTGNAYHPYKINLYQITDPDAKGMPYFGSGGIRNGLDYQYRDHRPGMNIPWKTGAANIRAILDSNNLVDTYEAIPAVFQEQGYTMIRLDVTESLQSWLSGSANQGWFLSGDQAADWALNDGVEFYGTGDPTVANRPKLVVTYVSASGNNNRPASITGLTATSGNNQVELKWTNPGGINGVLILRKAGVIPADPIDGTVVFDGSAAAKMDNQGLTNDNTYYYAIFAYDNLRNYSKKVWVKAIPTAGAGVPNTPTQLSVSTSGDNLTFNWTYVPGVEKWFQLEQREGTSGSWAKVAATASDHSGSGSLTVNLNDPNFNLEPNTGYNYRLSAVNDHGASGYTVTSSTLTTPAFLQAPANLTWTIISAGRVDLSWINQATDVTGYKVIVCDADQNELWSYSLAANATTCSVTGLNPGTKYLIKVAAIKGAEEAAAWTEPIFTTIDFKGGLL